MKKPMTDPSKPFGFRSTTPHGDCTPNGWRVWAGPFMIARSHTKQRFSWWSSRSAGWDGPRAYSVVAFGLSFSWLGGKR